MAFQAGSQVRPELGRADVSAYVEGGRAIGQALASVGQNVGNYMKERKEIKKQESKMEGELKQFQKLGETMADTMFDDDTEKAAFLQFFDTEMTSSEKPLSERYGQMQQAKEGLNMFLGLKASKAQSENKAMERQLDWLKSQMDWQNQGQRTALQILKDVPGAKLGEGGEVIVPLRGTGGMFGWGAQRMPTNMRVGLNSLAQEGAPSVVGWDIAESQNQ